MTTKRQNISVAYAVYVPVGNVNASYNEGNVIPWKKVTAPDGSELPYIAGQALRRMLRDRLAELGYTLSESEMPSGKIDELLKKLNYKTSAELLKDYADLDLFGYMYAPEKKRGNSSGNSEKGAVNSRTSPVRVSALISKFPYQGDTDLGTSPKSRDKDKEGPAEGGDLFETQICNNILTGHMLIDVERLGHYNGVEYVEREERIRRTQALFKALRVLHGGGRTARLLTDLRPKIIIYARTIISLPVSLDGVGITYDGKYSIDVESLKYELRELADFSEKIIVGLHPNFWGNYEKIKQELENVSELKGKLVVGDTLTAFAEIEKDIPNAFPPEA